MDISQIITQMIVLFLMMGTGYRCGKLNIIDSDFSKKLTNLILTITTPAMIIASVAGDIGIEKSVAIQIIGISLRFLPYLFHGDFWLQNCSVCRKKILNFTCLWLFFQTPALWVTRL